MTAPLSREQSASEPLISVVVCTHNRADKLVNCLARLSDQSLERPRYEVVVVDDCSTDQTAAVVQRFAAQLIRNERNLGPAASRNVGAGATSAPLLAFTDDDCLPDQNWLSELVTAFDDSTVVAVGGKIRPARTDRLVLRYYEASNPLAHRPYRPARDSGPLRRFSAYLLDSFRLQALPDGEEELRTIASANMAVRRAEFESLDGFDERFGLGGEDDDLCLRLRRIRPEGRFVYVPQAVVAHDYDPSLRDARRRNRTYGRAAAIAYLKGEGRLPAIYPFPLLVALSFGLAAIDLAFLAVPFSLVLVLYPGWIRLALARRRPGYLAYAPLQCLFELQTTIGFLGQLVQARRLRPNSRSERV